MSESSHRRWEGRDAVAQRTAWSMDAAGLRLRCVRQDDGSYVIEGRDSKGWRPISPPGSNPLGMLRAVVASPSVEHAVSDFIRGRA